MGVIVGAISSMFDQIQVRVSCKACGPRDVPVGQLKGKAAFACGGCGLLIRLDHEPLKSHLPLLINYAAEFDARRRRSGYVVKRADRRFRVHASLGLLQHRTAQSAHIVRRVPEV